MFKSKKICQNQSNQLNLWSIFSKCGIAVRLGFLFVKYWYSMGCEMTPQYFCEFSKPTASNNSVPP
jgi:hypothetical protein